MSARSDRRSRASPASPLAAALLLAVVAAYLWQFVPLGWIPHDEGTLGQAADRVMRGDLPHVQFEDPYSGGLSRLYALIFEVAGVDLLHLRYAIYIVGLAVALATFSCARRFLSPWAAAAAAGVAAVWSMPNYLAPLPSWWLLLAALVAMAALMAFEERPRWTALALAGLAVGAAVAVKQTGVYLAIAVIWGLAFEHAHRQTPASARTLRATQWAAAAAGIGFLIVVMGKRMAGGDGAYLFAPVLACAITLLWAPRQSVKPIGAGSIEHPLAAMLPWTLVPIAWLLWPYVMHGEVNRFLHGALVDPTLRLTLAVRSMPPAVMLLAALPLAAWVLAEPPPARTARQGLVVAGWTLAIVLPLLARTNQSVYQVLWQGARASGALLPVALCALLWTGRVTGVSRRLVFLCAAMLAWLSLNQFPFAAPVYFCYTAPLVIVAGIALGVASGRHSLHRLGSLGLLLGLFAVVCLNRGHEVSLGKAFEPPPLGTPLDLPRAHLIVEAEEARAYRAIVAAVGEHLGGGMLVAGPDAPEVYFLTGTVNDTGRFFDFFEMSGSDPSIENALARWKAATVIVINHTPGFSAPLPETMIVELVREFPEGGRFGRYEVRWR